MDDCADEQFAHLEARLLTERAVKAWRWDPEAPEVIEVAVRRFTTAATKQRLESLMAPMRVRFVARPPVGPPGFR
jgi:hypothetical protein